MADKINLTKESIVREATQEINKEMGEKYKKKYKALLKDKVAAMQVVSNIDNEIADLELKMEKELG